MDMRLLLFLTVAVSVGDLVSGLSNTTAEHLSNDTSTVSTDLTTRGLTLEDFVIINRMEFMRLLSGFVIYPSDIHTYGNNEGSWFVGENQTKYLWFPIKDRVKAWQDAVRNYTGDGLICVDGICLPLHIAQNHLKTLIAQRNKTVIPNDINYMTAMVSCFIVVGFVGISGNALIISAVVRSKSVRNSTNVLMCSLAASDILVLLICLPLQVNNRFYMHYSILPVSICKLLNYLRYFSILVSVFTMTVMAVERYVAICHPLKAKSYCTVTNARRAVAVVWLFSMGLAVPVIFVAGRQSGSCYLHFAGKMGETFLMIFYVLVASMVFLVPLCVMGPLYRKISLVLWESAAHSQELKGLRPTDRDQAPQPTQTRERKKVVKMLAVVLAAFVLCWGPAVTYDAVTRIGSSIYTRIHHKGGDANPLSPNKHYISTLTSLGFCNSFFNPLIFAIMSRQFQQYVKSLCSCCAKEKPKEVHSSKDNAESKQTTRSSVRGSSN